MGPWSGVAEVTPTTWVASPPNAFLLGLRTFLLGLRKRQCGFVSYGIHKSACYCNLNYQTDFGLLDASTHGWKVNSCSKAEATLLIYC